MTVYSDIISWAATRPWWQQQALVTLASTGDDAAFDYEALVDSMLSQPPADPPDGWLAGIQQPLEKAAAAVSLDNPQLAATAKAAKALRTLWMPATASCRRPLGAFHHSISALMPSSGSGRTLTARKPAAKPVPYSSQRGPREGA